MVDNRIKELREAMGLSLAEAADRAGMRMTALQRLENGERQLWTATLSTAYRIAKAVGVNNPCDLLTIENEKDEGRMKYLVVYTGDSTKMLEFTSNSRDSLKHLKDNFRAAGNDCVRVYDAAKYANWDGDPNTEPPILSMSRFSAENGGEFYRCEIN